MQQRSLLFTGRQAGAALNDRAQQPAEVVLREESKADRGYRSRLRLRPKQLAVSSQLSRTGDCTF
jgi:hypothetical protein